MKVAVHRGRTFDARSEVDSAGVYRGVFDVDSTSESSTDGVINEATPETFTIRDAAERAAVAAAQQWIDKVADAA